MMLIARGHHPRSLRSALALAVSLATPLCAAVVVCYPADAEADRAPAASLDAEIERYRSRLIEDIDRSVASVQKLGASVDLAAAKQARISWERSEVFTSGFASELDGDVDAWPAGAIGFHAIEAKLFGAGRPDVAGEVDALLHSPSDMAATARNVKLTPHGLLGGVTRSAYKVGASKIDASKIDGRESRISGTSIDDMRNNVDGIESAYSTVFAAAIDSRDHNRDTTARRLIDELMSALAQRDLRHLEQERPRVPSEELVSTLQAAVPGLALARPTLKLH
jgi:iron uptake system component EfeO